MNNRPLLIAALLLGTAALLSAASLDADALNRSEPPEHARPHGWRHQDIDLQEAARHAAEVFERIDSNKDDHISQAELAAGGPLAFGHGGPGGRYRGMHAARMREAGPARPMPDGAAGTRPPPFAHAAPPADDDDAGPMAADRPSREQLQQALFARLDADKDGHLTADEFANLAKARREEMLERGFKHMDADRDGVLSRAEFPPMQARLQALDSNHDGKVSRDELPASGPRRVAPRS